MKHYRIVMNTDSDGNRMFFIQKKYFFLFWLNCRYWYNTSKGEGAFTAALYYTLKFHSLLEAETELFRIRYKKPPENKVIKTYKF